LSLPLLLHPSLPPHLASSILSSPAPSLLLHPSPTSHPAYPKKEKIEYNKIEDVQIDYDVLTLKAKGKEVRRDKERRGETAITRSDRGGRRKEKEGGKREEERGKKEKRRREGTKHS
jgi:hypothetical protein